MKKITRTVAGVILIILGFFALVTPFSPGSWLILIGLEFLGLRILLENKLLKWAAARPESRIRRAMCRLLRLHKRDAAGRAENEETKGP